MKREAQTVIFILIIVAFGVLVSGQNALNFSMVVLNSSSGQNYSEDNLTVFTNYDENDSVKLFYDWFRNGEPLKVLELPFEWGSNDTQTEDYSSFGHPANVFGAVWNESYGYDSWGAYFFDGSYISVPDDSSLMIRSNLTILVRIKSEIPVTNYSFILEKGINDMDNYAFFLSKDGGLAFEYNATSYHYYQTANLSFIPREWYFVGVKTSDSKISFYLNGNVVESFNLTEGIIPRSGNLSIGKQNYGNQTFYFNGTIDEVMVFNGTLSDEEIKLIYQNKSHTLSSKETNVGDYFIADVRLIGFNETGESWSNNLTVRLNQSIPPSINIHSPGLAVNSSKLEFFLNVSISENGSIWYNVNGLDNVSLCSNCVQWNGTAHASEFGNLTLIVYANDSLGNENKSIKNFTLNLDSDNDGIIDSLDNDDDNDGINDSSDKLNGNLSNVNTNVAGLELFVNDSSNLSQQFEGVQVVRFSASGATLVEFNFNFSGNQTLDLARVIVDKQESGSIGRLLVKGINLPSGYTKTVYLDDLDSSKDSVCIKDSDVSSLYEIDSNCSGSGEVRVKCNGTAISGFTCEDIGSRYRITGLTHSLVIETFDLSTRGNNNSSSEENGGEDTNDDDACSTNWVCTNWSSCINGTQTRTCKKEKSDCYAGKKPEEKRNCTKGKGHLFDITMDLDKYLLLDSSQLTAVVNFENFGTNTTTVNLSFIILDKNGNEVYSKNESVGVETEKVFRKSFSDLNLGEGTYTLIMRVSYSDQQSEFSKEFKIQSRLKGAYPYWVDLIIIFSIILIAFVWYKINGNRRLYGF